MFQDAVSEILVFKTNILTDIDLEKVATVLNGDGRIVQWNVDRQDIDHVLRVQGDDLGCTEVISTLQSLGFSCEELPD